MKTKVFWECPFCHEEIWGHIGQLQKIASKQRVFLHQACVKKNKKGGK